MCCHRNCFKNYFVKICLWPVCSETFCWLSEFCGHARYSLVLFCKLTHTHTHTHTHTQTHKLTHSLTHSHTVFNIYLGSARQFRIPKFHQHIITRCGKLGILQQVIFYSLFYFFFYSSLFCLQKNLILVDHCLAQLPMLLAE